MRLKPGHRERRYRRTEALLLLLVLFILAVGGALTLAAKGLTAPRADSTSDIDINRADSAALARTLGVPGDVGKRLVAERDGRFGGAFPDVDSLARVALVPDVDAAARKMRESGASLPRDAATDQLKSLSSLSEFARKRFIDLLAQSPEATWERLLGQPLVSPERLRTAEPNLTVRSWKSARSSLLLHLGGFFLFALAGHVLLRRAYAGADPFLLPITLLLSGLGVLLLFSIKDPTRDMPTFAQQAQGVLVGGGVALLLALSRPVARLPLHRYVYLYALAAVAGTVVLGLLGTGPGGVKLSVAGTQPVEIIKVLMVLFLAAYLAERGPLLNDPLRKFGPFPLPRRRDAAPLLVLYALPLALFAIVRDLGPVLLLFGAFLLLIYLATGRGVYIVLGLVALLLGGTLGYLLKFGVFETRVLMWLSPWDNPKSLGDHLARGLWGMSSGGVLGSGLGLGGSRYIPRGGSDLALAALGEEAGLPATLAVVACFLALVARGLTIARNAGTDFDRLLAAGLSGLLGIQAIVILFGTLGLLPLAGITLPFVSYGKSSLIASFFMVGLLLLVSARAPGAAAVPPSPSYLAAARRVGVAFAILLGIVGVLRLVFVQGVGADVLASKLVYVPDADGVKRPHLNPRLAEVARAIPRGRILDRAGRTLAETRADGDRRVYPLGEATGHLVGYLDGRIGGPTGFEERFNDTLRGFATYRSLLPYWRMKDQPGFHLPKGEDVVTSLDSELQKAALASLKQRTAGLRDRRNGRPKRRAAAVVLDTRTGEVLAAATLPTYDPNGLTPARMRALNANDDGDFPLINRAISGYYPPGSTFKVVTASAQFANDRADYTVTCGHVATNVIWSAGGQTYARRRIVDDESERPHGLTNLTEAVAESCNVYFARAGIALGPAALREHAALYGFAKLPTPPQFDASLPEIAFGQAEMLASPLEMANVAQTVANGGARLAPQFVKSAGGAASEAAANPLTASDAARLADMMRRVTVSGTAAGRFSELPFSVAGKTGTAQNDRYDRVSHSWFIGFAPVETPRIAFAVIVENGGYGSQAAVPIARDILSAARP
ncbi:MAG TPA: penicillin-binding transpeptidase domain-containing protein [Armatimonadaceae bacterium]|nr:penicillin-binding transpeptidase domain-containing protein [Armatimonadaceae bacterium]